jgi:hypothetical protein
MPKYPNIEVELIGQDGNAFAILARVQRALRSARLPEGEIQEFMAEATSGDYSHLLATVMATVAIADADDEDWNDEFEDDEDEDDWN